MAAIEYVDTDTNGEAFTAETFLQALDMANDCWWESGDYASQWVFRGHGDASWLLKPSAWRDLDDGNKLKPLYEKIIKLPLHRVISGRMQEEAINGIDDSHPIYPWINSELEALHQFSELGNQLGLNVEPMSLSPLQNRYIYTGQVFMNGIAFKNTALAQHHGIPTRLLDFTFDPMLAIFHAAMHSKDLSEGAPDIAIWAVNRRPDSPIYPIGDRGYAAISFEFSPSSANSYLKAQAGLFVQFPFAERIFYEKRYWPCMEEYYSYSKSETPILKKYTLKASCLPQLREIFRRRGLSKAKLMPSLDNAAETVIESWK